MVNRNKYILCIICMLMAVFSIHAKRPLRIALVDVCSKQSAVAPRTYVDAVLKGGHIPFVIPRMSAGPTLSHLVGLADVVLFLGGEDVNPSYYNAVPSPQLGAINQRRDSFEHSVADEAVAQKKPMMGICRGQQFINVYFGGTLYQDLPTECPSDLRHRGTPHTTLIEPDSRLAGIMGESTVITNSHHHQAVKVLAPGFRVAARATDGTIESIECDSLPVAGVQFHPESMIADGEEQWIKLFANIKQFLKKGKRR